MSIVSNTILIMGSRDDLLNPIKARGRCYTETRKIQNLLKDNKISSRVVYAENHNNPEYRYDNLGQHADHYAIYIPSENRVIDYTMRQFDPDCVHPFVGTRHQWKQKLEEAWDYKSVEVQTVKSVSDVSVGFGV